jgi:hypothetical protein
VKFDMVGLLKFVDIPILVKIVQQWALCMGTYKRFYAQNRLGGESTGYLGYHCYVVTLVKGSYAYNS